MSRWTPGKKARNGAGRAYVGFWFHCSPNPGLHGLINKKGSLEAALFHHEDAGEYGPLII
ncbi:hypothetical protein C7A11_29730 [Pseudomonas simiae]|nr:hypothetical protein C7A13_27870 [Pseudomonas fluorescens]PRW83492.1 hypothetical protein C7A11_29730 [Pseudomonas simiae]